MDAATVRMWYSHTTLDVVIEYRMSTIHLSDGGTLDPAVDAPHMAVVSVVAAPRGLGLFVRYRGAECFIEAEQFPAHALIAVAAAAHLPDPHGIMPGGRLANDMNLNDAKVSIIAQLKALALSQGIAGDLSPHSDAPLWEYRIGDQDCQLT